MSVGVLAALADHATQDSVEMILVSNAGLADLDR
jgi:hypothetical protein